MKRLLLSLCLFVFAQPAYAWNSTGHKLVALIAYDNLTPEAKKQVDALLQKHAAYKREFIGKNLPDNFDRDRYAFMVAATWPDLVRYYKNPMHKENRPKWHFIDFPFNLDDAKGPEPDPSWQMGNEPQNAIQAMQQLANRMKSDEDMPSRAIALCWIEHIVGDIHQPLHCTSLYSKQFPNGDHGGNLFVVGTRTGHTPLHTFWDHILSNTDVPKILDYTAKKIAKDHPKESLTLGKSVSKTTDWANWAEESHKEAVESGYLSGNLEGVNGDDLKEDNSLPIPKLPEGYEEHTKEVARKRVATAGYRLAELLNELLKGEASK